jgi:hypothetical protein
VTDAAEHFKRLRNVYRSVFVGQNGQPHPAGKEVLANLREMTKFGSSPFSTDAAQMAYTVGMQDVFRHIQQLLNLSDADIYRLTATPPQEEGYFGND